MNRAWEYCSLIIIFVVMLSLYFKCYPKNYIATYTVQETSMENKTTKTVENRNKVVDNVINEARVRIDKAYESYKLHRAYEDLGIVSMEKGGDPMKVIIASTWRGGSSFLSKIIESAAPTFYSFESDSKMFTRRIKSPEENSAALKNINRMLSCDYSGIQNYSHFARNHRDVFKKHTLRKYCDDSLCFVNKFVSSLCRLFPFQTFRVMRYELSTLRDFFMSASKNIHIVYLARDPRAVMSSRIFISECQARPECMNPKILCDEMLRDFVAVREFHQNYPHNFTVLRFEDLLKDLAKVVPNLLRSVKMLMTNDVVSFLNKNTKEQLVDTFSVSRTTRTVPFKWRDILTFEYIQEVQRVCAPALAVWGYALITSEKQLSRKKIKPILPFDPYGDPTTEAEDLVK